MNLFEYNVFIEASPEAVFQVIADPRSKLAWVPAIRHVELESHGPLGPGTKYIASSGAGPFDFIFHERILEWVEAKRVAYEGHSPWGYFKTTAKLKSEAGGTVVHYRMDYTFPGGWFGSMVGRLVASFIRRPMERSSSGRLKRVIEEGLWQPDIA